MDSEVGLVLLGLVSFLSLGQLLPHELILPVDDDGLVYFLLEEFDPVLHHLEELN